MARGIAYCLLENQQQVTPNVYAQLQIFIWIWGIELKVDFAQREYFVGMLPHLSGQIAKTISLRIDCPNDVAHRSHRLACDLGNRGERISRILVAVTKLLLGHLPENADAREICPDVIM